MTAAADPRQATRVGKVPGRVFERMCWPHEGDQWDEATTSVYMSWGCAHLEVSMPLLCYRMGALVFVRVGYVFGWCDTFFLYRSGEWWNSKRDYYGFAVVVVVSLQINNINIFT